MKLKVIAHSSEKKSEIANRRELKGLPSKIWVDFVASGLQKLLLVCRWVSFQLRFRPLDLHLLCTLWSWFNETFFRGLLWVLDSVFLELQCPILANVIVGSEIAVCSVPFFDTLENWVIHHLLASERELL